MISETAIRKSTVVLTVSEIIAKLNIGWKEDCAVTIIIIILYILYITITYTDTYTTHIFIYL